MRRTVVATLMLMMVALFGGGTATARPAFPDTIPLPDGIYPEGIEVGRGHDFYVGSLLDGAATRATCAPAR